MALAVGPLAAGAVRRLAATGVHTRIAPLLVGVSSLSAAAAAIHFGVVKMHFDEYTLFGVFFVLAGIGQLAWALLVLFWPAPLLLWAGAAGNILIAALWAVDRIWGLPIGPEHWEPESVGFA